MKFTFKSFLLGFGIIAIILTLLPLIAVDYWWIRMFDFPHLQLTGLTLAAFLAFFLRFNLKSFKDYFFVVILLSCFIFQLKKIYEYTPFAELDAKENTISEPSATIKIYTANVLQSNTEYQLVLDQIAQRDPDLVLLMETNQAWMDAVHSSLSEKYTFNMTEPLDNTYGMLFYSRLPLSKNRIRHLVDKKIPSMETVVHLKNGEKVQVYAIHPTPPMPQHNPMSSDRDTEMMKTAFQVYDRQLPVIVMGDFNDVAWSNTTRLFREVSKLLDPRIGRGFYNTFHAKNVLFRWPLDHLFISEEFRVKKMELPDGINSDHFPTYSELTFEPDKAAEQAAKDPGDEALKNAKAQMEEQNLLNAEMPSVEEFIEN